MVQLPASPATTGAAGVIQARPTYRGSVLIGISTLGSRTRAVLARSAESVYCDARLLGEVAESAEGSRLLSGYRGKTSVPGSNPGLSAKCNRGASLLAFHAVLVQRDGSCDDALPDNVASRTDVLASPSCPSR